MNSFDIALSFLEGLALIASPCILPVLPLVLSTSIDGGRSRPFGIVIGFVVAFSGFVLLSRHLVEALHIDTDAIRYVSLVLLAVLGLVLIVDKLSDVFSSWTQGAANFGSKFGAGGEGGFFSGIGIGTLIGLVWTPCAGPILAAVLVQVIRQNTNLQSILVTVGFAIGAGIPMFLIALLGRKAISRFTFLSTHSHAVRKTFGVLMLLSVVYLGFGPEIQSLIQPSNEVTANIRPETPIVDGPLQLEKGVDKPYPAPELVGIQEWINSNPLTMAELKGKVVLIDFWTYSCINCVRTLPYVMGWDKQYRDKGLVIIGVHAPEFQFEKNVDNLKAAIGQYGIKYPVAVDNNLSTWVNYNNKFWPAHYLIDQKGQVVYTHFGEGDYDVTENNIRYLLGVKGKVSAQAPTDHASTQTQETYVGYARAKNFAAGQKLQHNKVALYKPVDALAPDNWTLGGKWKVEGQKITAQSDEAVLRFNFTAKKMFLVMGTADGQPLKVAVALNGQPLEQNAGGDVKGDSVTINNHTLYELINQPTSKNGIVEIKAPVGLEAYAFTFGN